MESFEILSEDEICEWLRGLKKGTFPAINDSSGRANRPTLSGFAQYTGLPLIDIQFYTTKVKRKIVLEKRRIMSKAIAEIDNGIISFVDKGGRNKKEIIRHDKPGDRPKVRLRYKVEIGSLKPALKAVDRQRPPNKMPSVLDLMGGALDKGIKRK